MVDGWLVGLVDFCFFNPQWFEYVFFCLNWDRGWRMVGGRERFLGDYHLIQPTVVLMFATDSNIFLLHNRSTQHPCFVSLLSTE